MYLIAVSKPNQKNRLTYENIKWRTGIYWFTLNQPAIYCVTGGLFCSSTQLSDLKKGHNHLVSMKCLDMIETWRYYHEPLPHSSRSDRVWAPIRDLAGSNSNSLVNLEWNRGMQRKSNLDTEERTSFLKNHIIYNVKQSWHGHIFTQAHTFQHNSLQEYNKHWTPV